MTSCSLAHIMRNALCSLAHNGIVLRKFAFIFRVEVGRRLVWCIGRCLLHCTISHSRLPLS